MLERAVLQKVLPKGIYSALTDETVATMNALIQDPELQEQYRENFLSYTQVLQEGRWKLLDYTKAIKYVTHKLMGATNIEAYAKAMPDRYARLVMMGICEKDIHAHVAGFTKGKLVNAILEQSIIPSWILNQDMYQKALNTQLELMLHAKSEKVRSDAANSLLTHLKAPEVKKFQLDVGIKEDSTIDALREATMALVAQQRLALQAGVLNADEVARARVIDAEVLE